MCKLATYCRQQHIRETDPLDPICPELCARFPETGGFGFLQNMQGMAGQGKGVKLFTCLRDCTVSDLQLLLMTA